MAADTFSATLGLMLMGTGNDNNSWGANANSSVFQIVEDAIANFLTLSVTGGTLDLSGSAPPAGPSQVRYAALIFTGTLTANQTVIVPNLTKFWWVNNATSGAFTLTIQTASPVLSVVIPRDGASLWRVNCNGANSLLLAPYGANQIFMPDGSVSHPPYSNANETNSGWYRAGTQDWRLSINSTDVLQITGPSAATPSVANFLSPLSLQQAGVQIIPPGTELPYAGVNLPAGFLWEYGQAVSRTTFANLLAALRASFTGTTANGNNTITSVGTDLRNLGLEGAVLEGNGVAGLTISSVTSNTITLSGNASASNTITIFAYPYGRGDGSTTFNVPDRRGRVVAGRDNMGNPGDAAAGRLTAAGGVVGTKLTSAGGAETETASTTLGTGNIPQFTFTPSGTIGGSQTFNAFSGGGANNFLAQGGTGNGFNNITINGNNFSFAGNSISIGNASPSAATSAAFSDVQPTGISNYIIKT